MTAAEMPSPEPNVGSEFERPPQVWSDRTIERFQAEAEALKLRLLSITRGKNDGALTLPPVASEPEALATALRIIDIVPPQESADPAREERLPLVTPNAC